VRMCQKRIFRYFGFYLPWPYKVATKILNSLSAKGESSSASQSSVTFRYDGRRLSSMDLICILREWGVEDGDTIMVHSSWDVLSPMMSSIREFLAGLLEAVGKTGTICMPVFPQIKENDPNAVFSVMRTPSSSGIVTEMFRRMPGVKRSLQMRSVAAIGPNAEYLLRDHHKSPFASGATSPYARFADVGAKIICLGVPATTNTMFHCGEDILQKLFPVSIYPAKPWSYSIADENSQLLRVECFRMLWKWTFICDSKSILQYFDSATIEYKDILGVECSLIHADRFLARLLALAKDGIHIYRL